MVVNFKLLEKLQIFSWFNITPKKGKNRHPWNTILWVHGIRPHGGLRYIPFDRFNSWIYQTPNIKVGRFGMMTIEIGVTFDNQILLEPHLTLELHLTSNIIGITFDTQILRSHI